MKKKFYINHKYIGEVIFFLFLYKNELIKLLNIKKWKNFAAVITSGIKERCLLKECRREERNTNNSFNFS